MIFDAARDPGACSLDSTERILAAATAVDLRGRGGAHFPFARKVEAVRAAGGNGLVVANGTEGEPASLKDRALLARRPDLVLRGALIAASLSGSREVCLVLDETATAERRAVEAAVADHHRGQRRLRRSQRTPRVLVRTAPPRFVSGESSAVARAATGRSPLPAFLSRRTADGGANGRPTLVSNVETLARLALLTALGERAYRSSGTAREPGTTLLTVHLPGQAARVVDVPFGTPVPQVFRSLGACIADLSAVLVGGYHGTWMPWHVARSARVSRASLSELGATLGAGVLVGLSRSACPLVESAPVVAMLAEQSAGQCGPCVLGLDSIATSVSGLASGRATAATAGDLRRWCSMVERRGACGHPDGVARFVRSLLDGFAAEVDAHVRGGCGAARRQFLPVTARPA